MDIPQANNQTSRKLVAFLLLMYAPLAIAQEDPPPDAGVLQGLVDSITALIGDWAISAVEAIICWAIEAISPVVNAVLGMIPESLGTATANIIGAVSFVEPWIPLTYGSALFAIYLAFVLLQVPLKVSVLLFVPTVG